MFEKYYTGLAKKYNYRFNWTDIRNNGKPFLKELELELSETHPLYNRASAALLKCESNDDVLFQIDDDLYAIVHLTYSQKNEKGFPRHKVFTDLQEAFRHIEESICQS